MAKYSWPEIELISSTDFRRLEVAGDIVLDEISRRRLNEVALQWLFPIASTGTRPEYIAAAAMVIKAADAFANLESLHESVGGARLMGDLSHDLPTGESMPDVLLAVEKLRARAEQLVADKQAIGRHDKTVLRDGLFALLVIAFAKADGELTLPSNDDAPSGKGSQLPYFVVEFAELMFNKLNELEKDEELNLPGAKIIHDLHKTASRFPRDISQLREARRRAIAVLKDGGFIWTDGTIETFDIEEEADSATRSPPNRRQ